MVAGRAGGEAVNWFQTTPRFYSLDNNMGTVWETLYDGWLGSVTINGITTRMPYANTAAAAKKLIEDYWEAAWALKP
jgi:hypothetical protein